METSTSQKSFVISSRQVTELSLNGRDFQSLMRTLPGVASNSGSDFRLAFNSTDQFNVNGLRGSMNNVYLDGSINTDVGANDGQYTQISLDSVGEFKVQTSTFNAEYGRNPGVMININTKSGGTDIPRRRLRVSAQRLASTRASLSTRPAKPRQDPLQSVRRQPRRPDYHPELLERR